MCRSIKTLRDAEPPADEADLQAAARQYVRKISGYRQPSAANHDVFEHAVDEVARVTGELLRDLTSGRRRPVSGRSVT